MKLQRWGFVTAPFIVFTVYTFAVSSSFPDDPLRMRALVSAFLGAAVLLLLVQRVCGDVNYFVPTIVLVLAVNWLVIHAVPVERFAQPETLGMITGLLLERPQLILYTGLMLMALLPPLLWQDSFTGYFSRAEYPVEAWNTPEFRQVNRQLSFFWAGVFLLCVLTQLVPSLWVQLVAPMVIVLTLGAGGTRWLVACLLARMDDADRT
jgi:hypothetical protein